MRPPRSRVRKGLSTALVVALVVLIVVPGTAAAARQIGATVVVEEGDTVSSVTATAGTIVVRGTVEGDLQATGGRVVIAETGRVEGRVRAYAGSVHIAGTVDDDVVVYGGSVTVAETGHVDSAFAGFGGSVTINGSVRRDATVVAGAVALGPDATIGGDLNYEGAFDDRGGQVDGQTRQSSDLDLLPAPLLFGPLFRVYFLLPTLLLGALLLVGFPGFAEHAVDQVLERPLATLGVGAGVLVAVPIVLALLAVTVVGIPVAVAGLALLLIGLWVADVYGRYVLGTWLLSLRDVEHRLGALVVGVLVVAVIGFVPYLGFVVRVLVLLFGLGLLALGLLAVYRIVRDRPGGLSMP